MAAALVAATPTTAARGRRVLLLSKNELGGGSTPFAQGGMAAVLDRDDSVALHAEDTLTAAPGCAIRRPCPRWCPRRRR